MINSAWNCETYSSFEGVSTDHRIVKLKIRLSLRRNRKQIAKTTVYDAPLLNNSNKYTITLRNKFDALQEISETLALNDDYKNFINAHMEAAAEYITTKLRAKHRVPWETLILREKRDRVPWETLILTEKRDNVKTAFQCNKRNPTDVNA